MKSKKIREIRVIRVTKRRIVLAVERKIACFLRISVQFFCAICGKIAENCEILRNNCGNICKYGIFVVSLQSQMVQRQSGAPTRNQALAVPYGESGAPEYLNKPVALAEGLVDVRVW